jgi:CheY-like chemotaxis protein
MMRRYLLVDDNRALAENLAEILRDVGAEVEIANSGREAMETVAHQRFDCVLSDVKMPGMDGVELVRAVRLRDPGLPIMLVTAYSGDQDLELARQQGLLAILPKPVDLKRLLHLLASARRDAVVALVEDDLALADNVSELLTWSGFTVVHADSVTATDALCVTSPFAALVDLRVQGGAEGEAMRRLAARYPDIPRVVITAHHQANPPVAHEAILYKPFAPEAVISTLEQLYRRGQ